MKARHVMAIAALAIALPLPSLAADNAPTAQGVIRGNEEALLSSEMAGRILKIAEDGDSFHKGDTLVEFSCDIQKAEEETARAAEQAARAQLENQKRLETYKSGGALDRALADAHLAEAQARTRAAAGKSRLCRVAAPYNGTVIKREAKAYESVNLMAPLIRVARQGPPEVVLIVPAAWQKGLKVGTPLTFAADGSFVADGKVTRIGSSIDSSSQTIEIKGNLTSENAAQLKSGQVGTVSFRP